MHHCAYLPCSGPLLSHLACMHRPCLSYHKHMCELVTYSVTWYCTKSNVMQHKWGVCVCRACGQSVPGRFCCCHPHHIPPEHGHAAQHFCHKRVPLHHAARPTVNANQERARLQSSAHCSRREWQPHACKCHESSFLLPDSILHAFSTCQLPNDGQ